MLSSTHALFANRRGKLNFLKLVIMLNKVQVSKMLSLEYIEYLPMQSIYLLKGKVNSKQHFTGIICWQQHSPFRALMPFIIDIEVLAFSLTIFLLGFLDQNVTSLICFGILTKTDERGNIDNFTITNFVISVVVQVFMVQMVSVPPGFVTDASL